jgi:hypothetical protein
MRNLLFVSVLGLAVGSTANGHAEEPSRSVELIKSPSCGCCAAYGDYLEASGFEVTTRPVEDIVGLSRLAGIPDDFQGCHLAMIDGYFVSGHVPVEVVERMLDERPAVRGITLPGMPAGSPGMMGEQLEPFRVFAIGAGGPELYAVE